MIHMKETLTIYTENLHKICVWCCVESLYIRCHVMSNTFPKKKNRHVMFAFSKFENGIRL